MRIVGGRWRGTRLAAVGKGAPDDRLRPTSDRVRESLFNLLMHRADGDPVEGARVLDLFAGTGALGLEALSRGAAHVHFVEKGRPAQALITENIAKLGAASNTRLLKLDATRLPPATAAPSDLVFLDPPYGTDLGSRALTSARSGGWLAPGALVVWEDNAPQPAPDGFTLLEHRAYGQTHLTFLEMD